jgi:hypothetical protein
MNPKRQLIALWIFVGLCFLAALAPLVHRARSATCPRQLPPFTPPWPTEIEGRSLTPIPLQAQSARFASAFPGKIQTFTDGQRDYVLRWVNQPTRLLHSSADCMRGSGYAVTAQPVWKEASGAQWGCFVAHKCGSRLRVRERIADSAGQSWTDVSAWYWNALLNRSSPPWLAITILEAEPSPGQA